MAAELQSLVDSLSRRLGRPVAVDDPHVRLLAYSSHVGTPDQLRVLSILRRSVPQDVVRWVMSFGVATAEGPVRLPPNEEYAAAARICIGIRHESQLLGYLWLIEGEEPLDAAAMEVAVAGAASAAVILSREKVIGELAESRAGGLMRDLLDVDGRTREVAAQQLLDDDLYAPDPIVVIVIAPVCPGAAVGESQRVAIGRALQEVHERVALRHSLRLVRPDHGIALLDPSDPSALGDGLIEIGAAMHASLCDAAGAGWTAVVGISDPQPRLVDAHVAYTQARQAADVARIVPHLGPVALWRSLGIYRVLSKIPREELLADNLHPGLATLLERHDDALVATLEAYLDAAGDAPATAARLNVHRATLYYRLGRIEELAGVSLKRGEDRLALHLGLKLARLAGLLAEPVPLASSR